MVGRKELRWRREKSNGYMPLTAMYFVASAEIRRRPIKKAAVEGLLPPPTSQY